MFDLGNIVGVSGLTTPALTWKFSGVEQAWVAAGHGVLVKVAGEMGKYGSVYGEIYRSVGHLEQVLVNCG